MSVWRFVCFHVWRLAPQRSWAQRDYIGSVGLRDVSATATSIVFSARVNQVRAILSHRTLIDGISVNCASARHAAPWREYSAKFGFCSVISQWIFTGRRRLRNMPSDIAPPSPQSQRFMSAAAFFAFRAIVLKHEQADLRGQVALLTIAFDRGDQA